MVSGLVEQVAGFLCFASFNACEGVGTERLCLDSQLRQSASL
jgi:hypothetical protein